MPGQAKGHRGAPPAFPQRRSRTGDSSTGGLRRKRRASALPQDVAAIVTRECQGLATATCPTALGRAQPACQELSKRPPFRSAKQAGSPPCKRQKRHQLSATRPESPRAGTGKGGLLLKSRVAVLEVAQFLQGKNRRRPLCCQVGHTTATLPQEALGKGRGRRGTGERRPRRQVLGRRHRRGSEMGGPAASEGSGDPGWRRGR